MTYVAGALHFAFGCIIIGMAPNMYIVLVGRVVQGFGSGLLVTMGYSFIRFVYPPGAQNAASTFYTSLWGAAVFLGPTMGGLFASDSLWRWAFLLLVPPAVAMAIAAPKFLPKGEEERLAAPVPFPQIGLILFSVLAISFAGASDQQAFRLLLLIAGLLAVVLLVVTENRSDTRLLPRAATRWQRPLSRVYLTMALIIVALNSDIYIPYFLQNLHGVTPLYAGYIVALVALGWTTGGLSTSSFPERRGRLSALIGCSVIALSTAGLALTVGRPTNGSDLVAIGVMAALLFGMGLGIGLGWAHLVSLVLTQAEADEADKASASINLIQSLAAAIGAALAGVIANTAGIVTPGGTIGAISASTWLYGLMVLPCLFAFLVFVPLVRTR
jgi:MFS family permease